jgi:hypothetical protein
MNGSYNLAGIADPVVDALVDKIIAAETRPALVTACRALDRVIRAGPVLDSALVSRSPPHCVLGRVWIPCEKAGIFARNPGGLGGTMLRRQQSSSGALTLGSKDGHLFFGTIVISKDATRAHCERVRIDDGPPTSSAGSCS